MNEWRDDIGRHLATAQERDDLKAQLSEARAVLREVERIRVGQYCDESTLECPVCEYEKGHAPDCRLKKALQEDG